MSRQTLSRHAPDVVVLVILAAAAAAYVAVIARTSAPEGMSGDAEPSRPGIRRAVHPHPTISPPARRVAVITPATPPPPPSPPLTRVTVDAARAPSWVVARAGSSTGKVLYAATLQLGKTIHVAAPRVFLRLGSAGSVDVAVNGRPLAQELSGTVDAVLTPRGLAQP